MAKRTLRVTDAQLVPAETIWPGRCKAGDIVMIAVLADHHDGFGGSPGEKIRTSLVVSHDFSTGTVETLNTIYKVIPNA